jgi:hypothetical protein
LKPLRVHAGAGLDSGDDRDPLIDRRLDEDSGSDDPALVEEGGDPFQRLLSRHQLFEA